VHDTYTHTHTLTRLLAYIFHLRSYVGYLYSVWVLCVYLCVLTCLLLFNLYIHVWTWVAPSLVVTKNENTGSSVFHNWNNYQAGAILSRADYSTYCSFLAVVIIVGIYFARCYSGGYFLMGVFFFFFCFILKPTATM
jgi:hypothetical protein